MKNKIISLLILSILLIGIASAGKESLGVFKQGETIRLAQVCDEASNITISSVTSPSSNVLLSNVDMVPAGNGEYSYNFTETKALGTYDVKGISDGCENTFTYSFEVVPAGYVNEVSNIGLNYIGTIILMIIALVVGFFVYTKLSKFFGSMIIFLTGIGIILKSPQNGWIGYIIMATGFLMIVYSAFFKKKHRR